MALARDDLDLRTPLDADWPAVLDLANRSVAHIAAAPTQEKWLENRRSFDTHSGAQHHWIAVSRETLGVVAYVGVECRNHDAHARIFIVSDPSDRADIGAAMLDHAIEVARKAGARLAWFAEYADDTAFISFLYAHGFEEVRRFKPSDDAEVCVLTRPLD